MTGTEAWIAITIGGITFLSFSARALYQLVLMAKSSKNGNLNYSKTYVADLARHHADTMEHIKELKMNGDKRDESMNKLHIIMRDIKTFLDRNEKDHEKQMTKHDVQIDILKEIALTMKSNGRH